MKRKKNKIKEYFCVLCKINFKQEMKWKEREISNKAICRDCTKKAMDEFFNVSRTGPSIPFYRHLEKVFKNGGLR